MNRSSLDRMAHSRPKLLEQVRSAARTRHYSIRTEEAYVGWIRRYIVYHGKRHPLEMGEPEINRFLTYLAVERKVAASTQNQALCAILFLYREVMQKEIGELELVWAKKPRRLPVVLTREEVKVLLRQFRGRNALVAALLYGTGMRLIECLRLRIQDIDFLDNQIIIRGGKGDRDRVTMLPERLKETLRKHLQRVRRQH